MKVRRIVITKITEEFRDGHPISRSTSKKVYVPKKGAR